MLIPLGFQCARRAMRFTRMDENGVEDRDHGISLPCFCPPVTPPQFGGWEHCLDVRKVSDQAAQAAFVAVAEGLSPAAGRPGGSSRRLPPPSLPTQAQHRAKKYVAPPSP